jgi:hypothetical protein
MSDNHNLLAISQEPIAQPPHVAQKRMAMEAFGDAFETSKHKKIEQLGNSDAYMKEMLREILPGIVHILYDAWKGRGKIFDPSLSIH